LVDRVHCIILRYYPGIRMEVLRKTTKSLNRDSRAPDLKPVPPEYKAGVLTTQPRRSVLSRRLVWVLEIRKCLTNAHCGFQRHRFAFEYLVNLEHRVQISFPMLQNLLFLSTSRRRMGIFGVVVSSHLSAGGMLDVVCFHDPLFLCSAQLTFVCSQLPAMRY
jgi:hypothetical protein